MVDRAAIKGQTWAADRFAIQDVIALYALGQDGHQGDDGAVVEQWAQVFAPDAIIDYTVAGAPICSFRELAVWMRGQSGQPGRMSGFAGWQHMLSLPVVFLDGDTATARTDFFAIHKVKTGDAKGERFDSAGAFHDVLVRTEDGWRIKHRRAEIYFNDTVQTLPSN